MNGILNINKPPQITSHDVVSRIRKLLHIRKVGHTGTLDPFATGVLVICVGKATKIIRFLPSDKEYIGIIKLGEETDTYDSTGKIVSVGNWRNVSEAIILDEAKKFIGEIEQIPPIYSAIKINGKKLYELARKGESVEIKSRKITIFNLEIIKIELPFVQLKIHCSAGTYIRSIAHDLGKNLACGAHLHSLTRTKAGDFAIENSASLEELTKFNVANYLISPNNALSHLPKVELNELDTKYIKVGRIIKNSYDIKEKQVRLLGIDGELLAIGEPKGDFIHPIRVFS